MYKLNIHLIVLLTLGLMVGLLSGCSHYRLGRPQPLAFSTLSIEPIQNQTFAPQIQSLLHEQLVKSFISEGTIQIQKKACADAVLNVCIVDFNQSMSATRDNDTGLARSYDVTLKAVFTLTLNHNGQELFKHVPVCTSVNLLAGDAMIDTAYQAMPVLTRQLAQRIRDRILNDG